ncbi:MAG: EpsI family protein [Acidobacteriales bacterium]|nr:EpsI family protein [Terriglobales bacterium]
MSSHVRFVLAATLLLAAAVFLHGRSRNEVFPQRQTLASFPRDLGDWTSIDIPISQDVLEVLGPGDFLLRAFRKEGVIEPDVTLFLAYFPSQRAGDTIHSPKNCLPGAGWSPVESSRIPVSFPGRPEFIVNRYVIAKGQERQLVLYWYWAHDRAVASEYWAKYYLVRDAIRLNRSDGSLIRVVTPLDSGETVDHAQSRLLSLAANVVSVIDQYVPR